MVLFIILLSALFRLTFLSTIEFKSDEATVLFLATRPLFGYPFLPGASISSFGILNPPLLLYLLFPFTAISTNPKIVTFFIAVLNVMAVGFFYLFVKKYYGKAIAVFSSILLAVSPWAIIFSRKIWAQDLILPFLVPLLFTLHKILIEKKQIYWLPYTFLTMLLLQLHQALIFYLLLLNIFLILKKPKFSFKYIFFGFVLGIIPLIPYFNYEVTNGFKDLIFLTMVGEKVSLVYHPETFSRIFQIVNQGNFHFIFGDDLAIFALQYPLIYKARGLFYFEYLLLLLGVIFFFRKYQRFHFLIYITFLLPLIYFLFRIPPEMHYFIALIPFLFLFLGTFFAYFWQKRNILKIGSLVLFFGLVLVSVAYDFTFFQFLSGKKQLSGDYGTIFAVNEERSKKLDKYKNQKEYQEMLLASYVGPDFINSYKETTKMIYSSEETKKNLTSLDERIKNVPEDARVRNELLAYYTTTPSLETLTFLRNKAKEIPAYQLIYSYAYNNYLDKNLRKAYESSLYNFAFEYPRHWIVDEESKETITLKSDELLLSFMPLDQNCQDLEKCLNSFSITGDDICKVNSINFLNQQTQEKICVDSQNNWQGTLYGPFLANSQQLIFIVRPNPKSSPIKDYAKIKSTISIILDSLRKIN